MKQNILIINILLTFFLFNSTAEAYDPPKINGSFRCSLRVGAGDRAKLSYAFDLLVEIYKTPPHDRSKFRGDIWKFKTTPYGLVHQLINGHLQPAKGSNSNSTVINPDDWWGFVSNGLIYQAPPEVLLDRDWMNSNWYSIKNIHFVRKAVINGQYRQAKSIYTFEDAPIGNPHRFRVNQTIGSKSHDFVCDRIPSRIPNNAATTAFSGYRSTAESDDDDNYESSGCDTDSSDDTNSTTTTGRSESSSPANAEVDGSAFRLKTQTTSLASMSDR